MKAELMAALDAQRSRLTADSKGLKAAAAETFNLGARVRRHLARHPLAWTAATAVAGLVIARLAIPSSRRHQQTADPQPKNTSHHQESALPKFLKLAAPAGALAFRKLWPNLERALLDRFHTFSFTPPPGGGAGTGATPSQNHFNNPKPE